MQRAVAKGYDIALLAWLFTLPLAQATACSLVSCTAHGIEVSRSFVVMVRHDGKPLAGVKVIITGRGSVAFVGVTDADGKTLPISGTSLKLPNSVSGATFEMRSAEDGSFAFDEIPAGTNVLHAEEGTRYEATDILIKLVTSAARESMILSRQATGCGGTSLVLLER